MPLYFFKNPAKNLRDANFQHLTLVIPLHRLNKNKEDKLASCRHEFTRAVSYFLAQSKDLNTTSPYKLHKILNQTAKEKFNIPSAILQSARDRGVAIQRIFWARVKKRLPTTPPVIKKDLPLHLRQSSYKIFQSKNGSWFLKFLYLPGRTKYLVLPLAVRPYVESRLLDSRNQLAACEIYRRKIKDRKWLVSVIIKIPVSSSLLSEGQEIKEQLNTPSDKMPAPKVIGVDLGIRHNAVLSSGKFLGTRYLLKKYGLYAKKKFSSAATDLKKSRFVSYINHLISRDIVDFAKKENAILALEDLTGLKNRILRQDNIFIRSLCEWSYRRLSTYIRYKAALAGVKVLVVDPANTSSTCSRCNYVSCFNREIPGEFVCKLCGYTLNPDLNAARVIARFALMAPDENKKEEDDSLHVSP